MAEMAGAMSIMDANAHTVALAPQVPLRMSDIGRRLLWLVPAFIILSGFVHARAEVMPCPSGIDERAIDEWLSGTVTKRHTSPKYDGATRVSAKSVCSVKHWVVGQVRNDNDNTVDYQGRYSVFPPDSDRPFTSEDVAAGLPWQIRLADGRVLYPIEPLYWVGTYVHRKWELLKEPDTRPTNVPSDAIWIGGLDKKEVYIKYKEENNGIYEIWLYEFFRSNEPYHSKERQTARVTSGPLLYTISPKNSAHARKSRPIFVDQYDRIIMDDGSMLILKR